MGYALLHRRCAGRIKLKEAFLLRGNGASLWQAATGKDKSGGRAFRRNQATKGNGSCNNPFVALRIALS